MHDRRPLLLTLALLFTAACQAPMSSPSNTEELVSTPGTPEQRPERDPTPAQPTEPEPTPAVVEPPAPVDAPLWPTSAPLASELLAPVDTEEYELDTTGPLAGEIDDVVLSPDGSRVAFRFRPTGAELQPETDLYATIVGDDRAQLVARDVREFTWSADGHVVAVVRTTAKTELSSWSMDEVTVEVVDTELGTTVALTDGFGYDFELKWGGLQVATDGMVTYTSSDNALWVYDPTTTTRVQLSDHSIQRPVFSRDGARLAFVRGNPQGTLRVYDRETDAIWTVGEQGLTGQATNGFHEDATLLSWITFVHGERRLELFDLVTGEVRQTAADGRHFALSPDASRAYYLRDSDSYVPFGTLCEWDFAAEQETVIDDNVRGGLAFAQGSDRVLYKDDYEYHMAGGSPFDVRAWDPQAGESALVAEAAYGLRWLDATGTMALVDHDSSYGTCQTTAYGVFAEGEATVEACILFGDAADGRLVLGHYHDGLHTLHLWSPWEAEMSLIFQGITEPLLSPDGSRLLYGQTDEAGLESLTLSGLDSPAETAWVTGAEEVKTWALTNHAAVGTSRTADEWTLHVMHW
jgi:hypothetical protein